MMRLDYWVHSQFPDHVLSPFKPIDPKSGAPYFFFLYVYNQEVWVSQERERTSSIGPPVQVNRWKLKALPEDLEIVQVPEHCIDFLKVPYREPDSVSTNFKKPHVAFIGTRSEVEKLSTLLVTYNELRAEINELLTSG